MEVIANNGQLALDFRMEKANMLQHFLFCLILLCPVKWICVIRRNDQNLINSTLKSDFLYLETPKLYKNC